MLWRLALVLFSAATCSTFLHLPSPATLLATAGVMVAAVSPRAAVLWLCALLPLGGPLASLLRLPIPIGEVLALAFLAGVALREGVLPQRTPAPRVPGEVPVLALVAFASWVVQAATLHERIGPDVFRAELVLLAEGGYFHPGFDLEHRPAAVLLMGLALLAAAIKTVRADAELRRQTIRMFAVAGAAVALLNVSRLWNAAVASGSPLDAVPRLVRDVRIDTIFGDVNTAGSYLVLILCCWLGIVSARSTSSTSRLIAALASLMVGVSLWLTSSRAALLSGLLTAGGWLVLRARRGPPAVARGSRAPAILLAVSATIVFLFLPNAWLGEGTHIAAAVRRDMTIASFRMWLSAPMFGVGVGQYFERSAEVIHDLPVSTFYHRENAHNNFLQMLAELGLVGFIPFALVTIEMLKRGAASGTQHSTGEGRGLFLGLVAFLLSATLGHPLLVPSMALLFWLALGVLGATSAEALPPSRYRRLLTAAIPVLVIVTLGPRVDRAIEATDLEHMGHGLSSWHSDHTGMRYRVAQGKATIFGPRAALIEVPLYVEAPSRTALVNVYLDGTLVNRLEIPTAEWRRYRWPLPNSSRTYIPISFEAEGQQPLLLRVGKVMVLQSAQ